MDTSTRCTIRKWLIQSSLGLVAYGLIIFVPAGTLRWTWGWALWLVMAATLAAQPIILIAVNADLLAERQEGHPLISRRRIDAITRATARLNGPQPA